MRIEIAVADTEEAELALLESGVDLWTLLEDAIGRRAWILGIFPSRTEADAQWAALAPRLAFAPLGAAAVRHLPDADWKNSYKEHFKAWTFGRLHWVPVWERPTFTLPQGHAVLWLDPGLAFGTGNHETTRLCIERLVAVESVRPAAAEGLRVVDAGCGSGILALSAALLGFRQVDGFDNDPEAVRVSRENAALNGLEGRVRFATAGLSEGLAGVEADVLLANIQADVLAAHAAVLVAAVAPGGTLAMSGILSAENDAVRRVFVQLVPDWPAESRVLGEWSDLCLRRPGP